MKYLNICIAQKTGKVTQLIRVMKLTALLFFMILMQASAKGYSQNITLNFENVSLEKVIKEIKRQSDYYFLYNNAEILKAGKVSVHISNSNIRDVLEATLRKTQFTFQIVDKTIVLDPVLPSASLKRTKTDVDRAILRDLKGKVENELGEPMDGVTVKVKGSTIGTSTNSKGEFFLTSIDNTGVLIFSGTNVQTTEVSYSDKDVNVKITLKTKVLGLKEVSVASTGYQTISKERATGSYSVVGEKALSRRPVSNISEALIGLVPGLQARENSDGTASFLIRGQSSLYAERTPLVVVDGFPIQSSNFEDINPNDVESITVLKDAAAASIWGARSANGVIVITTKHAKIGSNKVDIHFNTFTRVSDYINLDQIRNQANSADQVNFERRAWNNGAFVDPYVNTFQDITKSLTLAQEFLYANSSGALSNSKLNASLDSLSRISNNQQIKDLLLRRGLINQYNLSLSSSTDRNTAYGSILYENRNDGYKRSGSDRLIMNFNNQYQLTPFLKLNFGANIQYKKGQASGTNPDELYQISPYETLLNPDGSYSVNLNGLNRQQLANLPLQAIPYPNWNYNLLQEVRSREITREDLNIRLQGGLNIKIIDGLTFDSKMQVEKIRSVGESYYSPETFFTRNTVNSFTTYSPADNTFSSPVPKGGILNSSNEGAESYDFRNQLNFDRDIASKHHISAIAGVETTQYKNTGRNNPTVYGYDPELLQSVVPPLGFGSSQNPLENFLGRRVQIPGGNTGFSFRLDRYFSYYANTAYTYNSKYTISGSLRNDASNFITDNPKLRRSPFWSVGAIWNVKRESFLKDVNFLDNLNVRFTYGENGNVEKSTSTEALLNVGSNPDYTTGTIIASVIDNGNPFLRWERTATKNLGVDFGLFSGKFSGKIDLYAKQGRDIIGDVLLPAATGTRRQRFNNAKISNKGVEVELNYNSKIVDQLIYATTVTYAYNWNRIKSLYRPTQSVSEVVSGSFVEGKPINSVYTYTYLGVIDSVPYVQGPNGTKQSFDNLSLALTGLAGDFLNYEGTFTPPHTFGWANSFSYKGITLNAVLIGKFGGVFQQPVFNYPSDIGSGKTFVDQNVGQLFSGRTDVPQFPKSKTNQAYTWFRYSNYLNTTIASSSYIECKEISMSYELPQRLPKAIKLQSVRFFAEIKDLGLIYAANNKGYNPDFLPGSNRPVTSYLLGLNVKF